MSPDYYYLIGVLIFAIYFFWSQRLRADVTALLVMLLLIVPWPHGSGEWRGVLSYQEGFSGFGSSAMIMIAAMFVIGSAIVRTGAAEVFGLALMRRAAGSEWRLQLTILGLSTAASMFINDTTVVLIFLPLILSICRAHKLPPSRYLMFAAYGSLLGGQWTLVGTRSNIIISDFLRDQTGSGIDFFAFATLGAPIFLVSAVILILLGRHVLPFNAAVFSDREMVEFVTELAVPRESKLVGQRMTGDQSPMNVIAVIRDGDRLAANSILAADDVVVVRGTVDDLGAILKTSDLELLEQQYDRSALSKLDLATAVAVVPSSSYYIGQRLRDIPWQQNYGVVPLGVSHPGSSLQHRATDTTIQPGDSLLFLGTPRAIEHLRTLSSVTLLEAQTFPSLGTQKAWIIGGLLVAVIAGSISGILTPNISIPLAAAVAVLTGCVSVHNAYDAIHWPTLVTLGGIIPFGYALEHTGAAESLAQLIVQQFSPLGVMVVLGALLLLAVIMTQIIENAAVAIIAAPIAFSISASMGIDPAPAMVALAVCVSAGFATPIAHESTILVMGPGRYRFRHYLILGSLLAIVTWVISTLLYPFI